LVGLDDEAFSKVAPPPRDDDGRISTGDDVADEWERQIWAEEKKSRESTET